MQITTGTEGAVTVVKPAGPIISGELAELENHLHRLSQSWTKRLVINMSEVSIIDSAGLELLVRCRREMAQRGLQLKLSGLNDITQRIFDITGLTFHFEIFPDTPLAVRNFL